MEYWKDKMFQLGGFGGFHTDYRNKAIYNTFKSLYDYINAICGIVEEKENVN